MRQICDLYGYRYIHSTPKVFDLFRSLVFIVVCAIGLSSASAQSIETDRGVVDIVHKEGALVIWDMLHEVPPLLIFNGVQSSRDYVLSRLEPGVQVSFKVRLSPNGNRVITELNLE